MRLLALYFAGLATFLPSREVMCGVLSFGQQDSGDP